MGDVGRDALIADIEAIELAFVSQWAHFGQGPAGEFHDDSDLTWLAAPVSELPYNAVIRTHLGADAESRVDEIIGRYRARAVQFLWLVHPTAQPTDIARRLAERGLRVVEHGTGMSLDLDDWRPSGRPNAPGVTYEEADSDAGLAAYEDLIAEYWELGAASRRFVFGINRWAHELGHGVRFVAYDQGTPVGKAYLSWTVGDDAHAVSDDTASIFGVYVAPAARGLGVASGLMERVIERAAAAGRRRVVLHSSAMAVELYLRMGFAARCSLPVYATTTLHSLQPS